MHGPVTINSRKYDGTIRRSWQCRLIGQSGTKLTLMGEFVESVEHPELGLIRKGTISYEYYWLDRWYSIFRFLETDGSLRNYYCNINMPPTFENETLDFVDLDLDILVWPDARYKVLDRDEFEVNSQVFKYPEAIVTKAKAALDEVILLIESNGLEEFA